MPMAVWLVASSSSEGLINADRFLGRTGLTSGMSCVLLTTAVEALTPAVPVLIIRLQDADKISHAGSILVFGLNRNLSIGRGLAPLPTRSRRSAMSFMAFSAANRGKWTLVAGVATRRSIKRRPAGATPPTFSCNCRLAGPVPLLCTPHS